MAILPDGLEVANEDRQPPVPPGKLVLPIVTAPSGFVFPSIYSFPPFFTKQPNDRTRADQVQSWQQLILSYCRYHQQTRLLLDDSLENSELFCNPRISRRLRLPDIRAVLDNMVATNLAAYDPPPSRSSSAPPTSALIYYLSPAAWGQIIYSWVYDNGLTNSIMTLYELTTGGDLAHTTDFYRLDGVLLRQALATLVRQGKAQVFRGTTGGVGDEGDGVKFF